MKQPSLENYQEFREALSNYEVSSKSKKVLEDLKLVLMLAATSTGRNTLVKHLVDTGKYHYIVSDTTRPPRINDGVMETDGREYWFKTEAQMLKDLKAGEYLEAEIIHEQQVSGISLRELKLAKEKNKIAVTDIELDGLYKIVAAKPDTIAILLLPPSFEEWQNRIMGRGKMTPGEYIRRLQTALRIFEDGLKSDIYQYVIASDVDKSVSVINAITKGQDNPHQVQGMNLLVQLQDQLSKKINQLSARSV